MSQHHEILSSISHRTSLMNEHVWRGIETGVFEPMDEATARTIVDTIWQTRPLVPIKEQDDTALKEYYISYVLTHANREQLQRLVEPVVLIEQPYVRLYMNNIDVRNFPTLLVGETAQKAIEVGCVPMTAQQKIDFLTPETYVRVDIKEQNMTESGATAYGNRNFFAEDHNIHLRDASYGYTVAWFLEKSLHISEKIGSKTLRILDIGGGIGLGMRDIKNREQKGELGDLSFLPTIITAEEELVLCDNAGEFVFGPAEHLPYTLKDTQAIAVSNRAFEYFCYPDVALKSVVDSLTPGGWMNIMFDYRRGPLSRLEEAYDPEYLSHFPTIQYTGKPIEDRVRDVYVWIKKMEAQGYIRILRLNDDETGREFPPAGRIEIEKLRSIPDVEFLPKE